METSRTFGYTRVSTKEQNDDRQLTAMADFGVSPENIYRDKQSGKNFIRPAYSKLISSLAPGDILVIKSIDRLGRNYAEILDQWRYISKELQVAIVVLDLPILDTRQKDRLDLTGTLIADIVLTLLSYVAETERVNIRQHQLEGIEAAKRRGIRFGVLTSLCQQVLIASLLLGVRNKSPLGLRLRNLAPRIRRFFILRELLEGYQFRYKRTKLYAYVDGVASTCTSSPVCALRFLLREA